MQNEHSRNNHEMDLNAEGSTAVGFWVFAILAIILVHYSNLRMVLDEILLYCGCCEIVDFFQNQKFPFLQRIKMQQNKYTHIQQKNQEKPCSKSRSRLNITLELPLTSQIVYFKTIWALK